MRTLFVLINLDGSFALGGGSSTRPRIHAYDDYRKAYVQAKRMGPDVLVAKFQATEADQHALAVLHEMETK